MTKLDRRQFIATATALGATALWSGQVSAKPKVAWRERRDLFAEGVASGEPDSTSVLLWTRRAPLANEKAPKLTVEVASDADFKTIVARAPAAISADSDWTCRVLVGGLKPSSEYWYRFTDQHGNGSRIGRTLTAPADDDPRPVRFAFVSCQNANLGAQNAYRRMIYEDQRAAPEDRLGFVLHLGDFIYELVWYPEDRSQGYYDRRIRDIVRYAQGEKISDFHIPTTLDDYRAIYRAYLHDPDIQDARAHFPFVNMWDNHEFSWQGWQAIQKFGGKNRPAQIQKVAANQAWFEYQPSRARKASPGFDRFEPPAVSDVPVTTFDDHGLGQEANNLTAINSLIGYRGVRWGRNVDLIITDQRSFRSDDPLAVPEADALGMDEYAQFIPEEFGRILDAGRTYNGGHPPATVKFGKEVPNFRKDSPPQTLLGAVQKAWFLDRLSASRATWKIWGNTQPTLDQRADPQNLPKSKLPPWPYGYASFGLGDPSGAYVERAEIYDHVAKNGITGFAAVAGDRHSFWAGLAAKALPPAKFEPVGIAFVTGSISAPGFVEAMEHKVKKDDPLGTLFIVEGLDGKPQAAINMLMKHGVASTLEYAKSHDLDKARAVSNPDNAPHLSFVDMGGHGYGVVTASPDKLETEFVCIPRPIERSTTDDGGPIRYRVVHTAALWKAGEAPKLEQRIVEGDVGLSV
jgi:alkaline phosphatase D